MPQLIPQTKAAEAFSRLVELIEANGEPDELSLARFEKAARESLGVDPILSYQVLGIAASFRWDRNGTRANFEAALGRGGDAGVVANYGRAFAELNDPWVAAEKLHRASDIEPENLGFLRSAIAYYFCAGEWDLANDLARKLEDRTQEMDLNIAAYRDVIDLAQSIGVKNETVIKSMQCALRFLTEKRIHVATFNHGIERMPGDECVYLGIEVPCTDLEARALDDELTPRLFDEVDDLQLSSFVLSIESHKPSHEIH